MYLNPVLIKRILVGFLSAFLLLGCLGVTAFAEETEIPAQPEQEETIPEEPAPEEPQEPAPETEREPQPAPEEVTEPENGSDTEPIVPEDGTVLSPETGPDAEQAEPEAEADPAEKSETEAGSESQLPPLPEDWSIYGEPEGYVVQDIYERVYRGAPLSMNEAMRYLEGELSDLLNRMADSVDHDDVYIRYNTGLEPTYRDCTAEIAAVFCALSGWEDPLTLKSEKLSTEQVELLRSIYWNMSSVVPTYRQDVTYSYSEDGSGEFVEHSSYHVQLDVSFISAAEYLSAANEQQQRILDTVLSEPVRSEVIKICSGELSGIYYGTDEILAALPEDLDPVRRGVVESACSLVCRVSYFWGGKSDQAGWDYRWGVPKAIIDDGSGQLGDVYPYGLDCAGLVTWAFINATGDPNALYTVGHGTVNQFNNCEHIEISELQPGDLVFAYGYDTGVGHVGIVVGFSEDSEPLVCHSSSSGSGDVRIELLSSTGLYLAATPSIFYDTYQ